MKDKRLLVVRTADFFVVVFLSLIALMIVIAVEERRVDPDAQACIEMVRVAKLGAVMGEEVAPR